MEKATERDEEEGPVGEQITWKTADYKISFIRPCLTDRKKKMAEARFLDFQVDAKHMCEVLMNSRQFDNVNYSEKLGIARIEWMGKTVTIFNTGQITIRSAESIDDVKNTIEKIYSLVSRLKPPKEKIESKQYRPGKVDM